MMMRSAGIRRKYGGPKGATNSAIPASSAQIASTALMLTRPKCNYRLD